MTCVLGRLSGHYDHPKMLINLYPNDQGPHMIEIPERYNDVASQRRRNAPWLKPSTHYSAIEAFGLTCYLSALHHLFRSSLPTHLQRKDVHSETSSISGVVFRIHARGWKGKRILLFSITVSFLFINFPCI